MTLFLIMINIVPAIYVLIHFNAYILGEYGIVYRGFLSKNHGTEVVAVKTLKG